MLIGGFCNEERKPAVVASTVATSEPLEIFLFRISCLGEGGVRVVREAVYIALCIKIG